MSKFSDPSLIDLGKQLLEAARHGDEGEVRNLLSKGASFTTDWLGTSPLHLAAQNGHSSTALLLMRAGMSCAARTKVDKTPLHLATQYGHIDLVNALIKHGASVNATDMLKMTPLHWASVENHQDIAEILLKNGADIKLKNKFDKTVLDICIKEEHFKLTEILQRRYKPCKMESKSIVQNSEIISNNIVDSLKVTDMVQSNLWANLSTLANLSTDLSNSVLSPISRYQAGLVNVQSASFDDVKSFILTDAGRLAIQYWNKGLENDNILILEKDSKTKKATAKEKLVVNQKALKSPEKQQLSLYDASSQNCPASSEQNGVICTTEPLPCTRDVDEYLVVPCSSSVGSMPFSNIFSDYGNRSNSESDDACALDLERDILQRQLDNAKHASSKFHEESQRKENEAETYGLQLELLCKKQTTALCKDL